MASERGDEAKNQWRPTPYSRLVANLAHSARSKEATIGTLATSVSAQGLLVPTLRSDIRTWPAIAKAPSQRRRSQGTTSQEGRHQKEHEIREAVEKRDRPQLETPGLFRR